MPAKLYLFLFSAVLFILFVFFTYVVHKDVLTQFDFDTTVRLQDNIPRRVDDLFSIFSDIGNFEVTLIVLVVLFIIIRKFISGFLAVVFFAGFHIIEIAGKTVIEHLPPPQFLLRTKEIIEFPQFHVRSANSYPSGHAGRTIFISVILLVLIWQSKSLNSFLKLSLSVCIIIFDSIMLISRVYLGEHWATDVIGGTFLGGSLGLISIAMAVNRKKTADKKKLLKTR